MSIDGVAVVTNTLHIPQPYTDMYVVAYVQNDGIPASSTTLTLDFIYFGDVDRIQIDNVFDESLRTSITGPNDTNNVAATVTPYNALRIAPSASQILFDPFVAAINTADVWNVSSANGGNNPANGGYDNGDVVFDPGTTVNGFSLLQTKDSFPLVAPGYLLNAWLIVIDPSVIINNYRFWGLGTTLATPNLTTPIVDGYGFEVGTDGILYAVVYQGTSGTSTTRVVIDNLSIAQPTDGNPHLYYTFSIGTEAYWSIDTKENVVASYKSALDAPHFLTLPLTALSISDGAAATLVAAGVALGDDSHLGQQIVDGTYAWRRATVKKASTAATATDTSLVVALHPTTPLPAGTNVIGKVDINSGQSVGVTQGTSPWVVAGTVASNLRDGSGNAITSTASALDVNIKSGGSTQYTSGAVQATPTGTVVMGLNPSNVVKPLAVDNNGYLEVNVVGGITVTGGSFTAASDGPTGSAVPLDASFVGYKDMSGNLTGVSASTPLPITGNITVTATDPSVGVVGSSAPADATQMGFVSGGNLTVPSTATPLPVSVVNGSVTATVTGSVSQSGNWTTRIVGNSGANVDAPIGGSQPANLIQVGGQVTTGVPSYTTAQQNPISLTTLGGVRTDHSSVAGTALTAVPSTFGVAPAGSVQGVNASLFAGTVAVPSGTLGTSPGAVSGAIPVNASLYIGTTAITTTGTAGQPLVGAIPFVSGSPIDPRQVRALTSSDQITVANSSLAVTGTFWQATQPVSGSVSVSNFPATQPVSWSGQSVGVTGSVAVTGTFWQATQPVSGTVSANISGSISNTAFGVSGDVAIVNSTTSGKTKLAVTADPITFAAAQHVIIDSASLGTVAVSGTFWQTTQPVSGSVSVSNFPSSQDVTGTVAILGTVPVTGTFWQATQPVSGDVTSNQGAASAGAMWSVQVDNTSAIAVTDSAAETSLSTIAGAITSAQMRVNVTNASMPVTGTFYQTTQPVSQSGTWTASTNADAPIAGGAAPSTALVVGGTYNNPSLNLTTGQSAGLSLDNTGSLYVNVSDPLTVTGRLSVALESSQLFVDTFDSASLDTNLWQTPTSSGGGVAASTASGSLTLGTGTTTGGYSVLQSAPNFPPAVPSYLTAQFIIELESPVTSQTYRFWGFGTTPSVPTTAAPLTNAVGFELYTDGKMYAVVYAGGVRTVVQDLSASTGNGTQPPDANFHRYSLAWRSDKQFFMIDSSTPCATGNFTFPQVQTLPLKLQAIAGTSPLSSGALTVTSIGVGDSGTNNMTISDATYGFRGATVDAGGNLHVLSASNDGTVLDTQASISSTGPGATYNTGNYGYLALQFGGIWAGTIRVEGSNDGVNWVQQYVQYLGSGYVTDVVQLPTIVQVVASTTYMRYNVVQLEMGTISVKAIGNTGTLPTTSLLGMSFDTNSGVQQNVNVSNLNKDITGGLILSDAPAPILIGGGIGQSIIIDTQGYQTLNITSGSTFTANISASNDKMNYTALTSTPVSFGNAASTSITAGGNWCFPCLARYVKITVTAAGTATIYLRQGIVPAGYFTNLGSINGPTVVGAGIAGTLAVGGNVAVGSAQTAYPLVTGGVDSGGGTRRILTDTSGSVTISGFGPVGVAPTSPNLIAVGSVDPSGLARRLGSVFPNSNSQNLTALATVDLTQFEGQNILELLAQILIELKINNQYLYELPRLLTTGTVNSTGDEPAALRNDPNISTAFGDK